MLDPRNADAVGSLTRPGRSAWPRAYRWVALLFAAYPLAAVLTTRPEPLDAVLAIIATACFGGLLVLGWRVPYTDPRRAGPLPVALVLAILAIAVELVVHDVGTWVGFFFFASTGASPLMPQRRAIALMTLSGLAAAFAVQWATGDIGDAALQGMSVTVVGMLVFSLNVSRRANIELLAARHEVARLAVADERARISRDLHDTLGHSLSLIALKSELARKLLPTDPGRAQGEIEDVERAAREALAAVRETVSGYRRPTLDGELANAREALAAAAIGVDIDASPGPLPEAVESALAWTVREAVTNVVRHSGATHVRVSVGRDGDWAAAGVVDDGRGRESPTSASQTEAQRGSGLRGLAERIEALGGRFEAGPLEGGGFRLAVRLPIAPAPAAAT